MVAYSARKPPSPLLTINECERCRRFSAIDSLSPTKGSFTTPPPAELKVSRLSSLQHAGFHYTMIF
jgi:hypothetical protein